MKLLEPLRVNSMTLPNRVMVLMLSGSSSFIGSSPDPVRSHKSAGVLDDRRTSFDCALRARSG